jgi:antitoxin StbD
MKTRDRHQVLSTREARNSLPRMLRFFRDAGERTRVFVIGAHRRPEAVVISYDEYLRLIDLEADRELEAVAASRLDGGAESREVDLAQVAHELGVDPERVTSNA